MTRYMDRIKVLLICHFSNPEIRAKLKLRQDREYHDFAVWITNRLAAYTGCDELEMHIVAPHKGMTKRTQEFELDGINYYFYNAWTDLGKFIEKGFNVLISKVKFRILVSIIHFLKSIYWSIAFCRQKNYVKAVVRLVKPDIIHLNGAENPYYSATVLGLEEFNFPICITIQGIVGDPVVLKASDFNDRSRIKIEHRIQSSYQYYIVGSPEHYKLVKQVNPCANYLFSPGIRTLNIDPLAVDVQKEFDFVFMARVTPIKGIEHLLKALSTIHKESPEVSLLVLGPVSKSYLAHLKGICEDHGIGNNVVFGGHIPRREDLFMKVLKARIFVLPTTIEGLATSAVEAMLLGLPVVTYATGGMPFLNSDGENVLMCETGNIEGLTNNMMRLLTDKEFAQKLAHRGQEFAKRTFGAEANVNRNIRQYRAIIEHYHHGTPIPDDLMYTGAQ
ncbi:MAG: glycosyltransferase family 4 protein [Clostridia bacterium]|nr:glycosyltransferase family 4 protein [Clostridia bacterium]